MDKRLQKAIKAKYLEALASHGVMGVAAKTAGITRESIRAWQLKDEEFAQECKDAIEDAIDKAEMEIVKRGVEGFDRPVMYKGQQIYKREPSTGELMIDDNFDYVPLTESIHSEDLLKFYTQAKRKEFGQKGSLQLSGPDGGPIPVERFVRFISSDGNGRPDPLDAPGPEES